MAQTLTCLPAESPLWDGSRCLRPVPGCRCCHPRGTFSCCHWSNCPARTSRRHPRRPDWAWCYSGASSGHNRETRLNPFLASHASYQTNTYCDLMRVIDDVALPAEEVVHVHDLKVMHTLCSVKILLLSLSAPFLTAQYLRPSFLVPDETLVLQVNVQHVALWHHDHQPAAVGRLDDRHVVWFFVGEHPSRARWDDETRLRYGQTLPL